MNAHVLIDENGEPLLLRGLALPFGQTIERDRAPERFIPEAFAHSDALAMATLQWSHAEGMATLASVPDGSLSLYVTGAGLLFDATLAAHPTARRVAALAREGEMRCSVSVVIDAQARDGTVTRARLEHVGVTVGEVCYATTCAWLECSTERYPRLTAAAARWRRHLDLHLSAGSPSAAQHQPATHKAPARTAPQARARWAR